MFRCLLLTVAAAALGHLLGGAAAATAPAISWATTDVSTTSGNDVGPTKGISLDDAGNVYTLGQANGDVTFGSLTCPDQSVANYAWLLKQDKTGAPLW